ncbi:tetratricopeptide repeat protein [Pelomyxa schiedti]|nr:tetratricopeptide repeat protein [Pelomyxa schiedti]
MRSYCMGHSVSSDSFSGFAKLDPLCSQHNHDADVAISILEDRALRNAIESLITGSETGTSPLMDLSSAKLSTHFHTAGVNIGLIGKACLLAQDLKSPQLAAILCEEAICRTLKSVLREEMRNVLEKRKFSEKVMTQVAKSFLSRTFCSPSSKTKSPLWTAVVKRCLEKYDFAVTPSSANIQSSSFIHRLQEQLGLAWDLAAMDPSRSLCDFVTGCSPSIQLLKIPPFFQKEAAEKFCLEELAVREKALGASHPALVSTLLAIVDLYFQWVPSGGSSGTDSFHLCASAAERAVAITKEHDWDCLVKAGQIYLSFGDLERAEVYFKKLYQFSSETNHPKLGQSINNLAIIYKKIGKLEQAKEMYVKALEIHQRNNAKDLIASTSMNIGILSREMKQISEARKYYTFAEKLFREVLEENNPRLLSCQTSLSNVLAKEGNFTECKELLSRVFSKLTEGVGGEHVKLAYMYSSYSYLHRRMREYETSKDYIMKAIEVWKRLNRSDTIEYAIALEGLVYLHHHTGCTAEATAVLKEVISILTSKKTLLADARAVKRAHKLAAILGVSLEGSPLAHS